MTVGGISREAIFTQPPFTAQRGGEVFIEDSVPVQSENVPTGRDILGFISSAELAESAPAGRLS
jgi:hypothetical protein